MPLEGAPPSRPSHPQHSTSDTDTQEIGVSEYELGRE